MKVEGKVSHLCWLAAPPFRLLPLLRVCCVLACVWVCVRMYECVYVLREGRKIRLGRLSGFLWQRGMRGMSSTCT